MTRGHRRDINAPVPNELLVNIDVPDLNAAIAFYETGLGFSLRRLLFEGSVAEMALGGIRVFLLQHGPGSTAIPNTKVTRDYADHWTPVHLDIVVDDLGAAIDRALTAGARQPTAITRHAWGDMAAMRDPFGHGFCLIAFRSTGYNGV